MTSPKLKHLSCVVCTMDLYADSMQMLGIKSSTDFFRAMKKILCEFSNCESYILDFNWSELKRIKYEVKNSGSGHFKPQINEIQIFQMNISKKGNIVFQFQPKSGSLTFHTFDIYRQTVLDSISQNDEEIEIEVEDYGRPSEELLVYVAKFEDGTILQDSVDVSFSYSGQDDTEVNEELDPLLLEITNEWYEAIFNRK